MTGQVGNPIYLGVSYGLGLAGQLADIGYTLRNPDRTIYRARVNANIEEIGGGDYQALVGFNEEWQGFVEWDIAGDKIAREAIEILPNPALLPSVSPYLVNRGGPFGDFMQLLNDHGSIVTYHRDDSVVTCPCITPQGSRDPIWHLQNSDQPICNHAGMLPAPGTTTELNLKAFMQPVQSGAVRRLTSENIQQIFGEVKSDDHLGIFPVTWDDRLMNFYEWGESVEDWIEYNGRRYTVVSANLIPDPSDGNPWHHWEIGLRLVAN